MKITRTSFKIAVIASFLVQPLDSFPDNLGDVSDEQGKRFHQDIKIVEERYRGRWGESMMTDYCWSLKRELPIRKANKRKMVP